MSAQTEFLDLRIQKYSKCWGALLLICCRQEVGKTIIITLEVGYSKEVGTSNT